MTVALNNVVAACLGTLLRDEPWQDLGFAKRPRYGAFFQRFRPEWRTGLENKIAQEMLAMLTAAQALADRISSEDIRSVVAAYTERADVVAALGYSSGDEGVQHLTKSIAEYRQTPPGEWHILILKRIDPLSIPDKKLSARLLVGSILFANNMGNMILSLRQTPVPDTTSSDNR